MKKLKILLTAAICAAFICGGVVQRGEEKMQFAFDGIKTGEDGTTISEINDMLGEGYEENGTFRWQNGSMLIIVTVDENGIVQSKRKNW